MLVAAILVERCPALQDVILQALGQFLVPTVEHSDASECLDLCRHEWVCVQHAWESAPTDEKHLKVRLRPFGRVGSHVSVRLKNQPERHARC